jgi:hypothetical protein
MGRVLLWVATGFGLVLAATPAHASPNPAGFWLSFSGEYRVGTWQREWSAFLSLNVPLDRVAAPRVMSDAPGLAEEPPKKTNDPAATPPTAPDALQLPAALLTPRLARGAVRHALAEAGYLNTRARLASLGTRARSSAALPEVGLRTSHTSGQTLRLTPTNDDPYRYVQAGTSELSLEARLTWHLDRLVFASEEVHIERLQHERDAAERRLIDYVLERLVQWRRGLVRAADPNLEPDARETAELEAVAAAVELDVLTGGWFSWAIGESEGQGAAGAGESAKVEVNTPRHAR